MSEIRDIVRRGSAEFLDKLKALNRAMSNEHVGASSDETAAVRAAIEQVEEFIDGMDRVESDEDLRDQFSAVVEALMPAIQNAIEARKRLGVREHAKLRDAGES